MIKRACDYCLYVYLPPFQYPCSECIKLPSKPNFEGFAISTEWKAKVPRDCEKCIDLNYNDCLKGE